MPRAPEPARSGAPRSPRARCRFGSTEARARRSAARFPEPRSAGPRSRAGSCAYAAAWAGRGIGAAPTGIPDRRGSGVPLGDQNRGVPRRRFPPTQASVREPLLQGHSARLRPRCPGSVATARSMTPAHAGLRAYVAGCVAAQACARPGTPSACPSTSTMASAGIFARRAAAMMASAKGAS